MPPPDAPESNSTQTQESGTVADESVLDVDTQDGSTNVLHSNVTGDQTLNFSQTGVSGETLVNFADRLLKNSEAISGGAAKLTAQATEAITTIAKSNAGAETETGRLLKQAAVPVLLAGGMVAAAVIVSRKRSN